MLFVRMSLGVFAIRFPSGMALATLRATVVMLLTRRRTVGLPVDLWHLRLRLRHPGGSGWVLTWGGLRGGISVALALAVLLPASPYRETLRALTCCVVVFSILEQGLAIGGAVRRAMKIRSLAGV